MSKPDPLLFSQNAAETTVEDDYDLSFLLPSSFSSIETWAAYLQALAKVFKAEIHIPTELLSKIRTPELQGRVYKALHAQMMGVEIPDEIMSDDAYDRLNRHAGHYQEMQGKDNFIKFLAYVLGVRLSIVRLWTKDYVDFFPGHGKPIWEGGDWYPTTHVGVNFDDKGKEHITEKHIIDLFYGHAKADLVLKWIARNQVLSLGNIYLSLLTLERGDYRFRLNGVGDFNTLTGLELLQLEDGFDRCQAYMPHPDDVGLGFAGIDLLEYTAADQVQGFYWNRNRNPPVDSSIIFNRPSPAFMFTTIMKGVWVAENVPRWLNAYPISGTRTGLVIEKEAFNYLRSSTRLDANPWKRGASLITDKILNDNIDGSDSVIWRTPLASDTIRQTVELAPGTYCFQSIAKNLLNAYIKPVTLSGTVGATITAASTAMANNWRHFVHTFILTETSDVEVSFEVQNTEIFYAGIENGDLPTSPIMSDDCSIGVRAADILWFKTNPSTGAFSAKIIDNNTVYNSYFANKTKTILTAHDKDGVLVGELNNSIVSGNVTYTTTDTLTGLTRSRATPYDALLRIHMNWNGNNSPFYLLAAGVLTPGYFAPVRVRFGNSFTGFLQGLGVLPFPADHNNLYTLGVY